MGTSAFPTPQQPAKRAVNLTAGAFSFATPSPGSKGKRDVKGKGKERDGRSAGAMSALSAVGLQTPQPRGGQANVGGGVEVKREERTGGGAAEKRDGDMRAMVTPIRELSRPPTAAGSSAIKLSSVIPLPPTTIAKKEREDERSTKTPRKMTSLSSFATPWGLPSRSGPNDRPVTPDHTPGSSKRRRLGDLEVQLPVQKVKEEKEDLGRRVALRYMGEGVRLEGVGQIEEVGKDEGEKEVGVGISPRKGKVKWTGRGEPPLALRLNALLTTQTSSLTLFYTSLQHTLHPSHPSHRSANTSGNSSKVETKPILPPSALEHIRTAPFRLRLIRPLSPREHAAQLWLASVRTWPLPPGKTGWAEAAEDEIPPEEVLVNFAQAAKGAAGVGGPGADVKVIAGRWWDRVERGEKVDDGESGRWEVGVWSEWSVIDLPVEEEGEGMGGMEDVEVLRSGRKVVFVSRYMIADRR